MIIAFDKSLEFMNHSGIDVQFTSHASKYFMCLIASAEGLISYELSNLITNYSVYDKKSKLMRMIIKRKIKGESANYMRN